MYIIIIIKSTLHAGWLVDALIRSKPGLCWLFAAAVLCCCCVVLLLLFHVVFVFFSFTAPLLIVAYLIISHLHAR